MDVLAGLLQQQLQQSDGIMHARDLHAKELKLQEQLHNAEIHHDLMRFRKSELLSLDLQEAKLKTAVRLAERDAVRDALSHRSQIAQSIMMVNTVVMGCIFMFIYQLNLNAGISDGITVPYVVSLGLAVIVIVLSIALALALQKRVLRYELHKPLKRYQPCDKAHASFSSYFDCHCRVFESWSLNFFYAGTALVMVTATLLMYAQLSVVYGFDQIATVTMVLCIGAALVLLVGDFIVPTRTHMQALDIVGGPSYETLLKKFPEKRREVKRQGAAVT